MATRTTASKHEPRALPELVQNLPQELFDRVYEETFSWTAGAQNIVDGDGKTLCKLPDSADAALTIAVDSRFHFARPPISLLRVDRSSRYKVLKSFFSNTMFAIFNTTGETQAIVWVKERKFNPDELGLERLGLESHILYTGYQCEEVYAFARALFAPGLSRGLKWDRNMVKYGDTYCYTWSWEMEGLSS